MRPSNPTRLLLLAIFLLGSVFYVAGLAQSPATLPSRKNASDPEGADRKLANWDKLHEYYQAPRKRRPRELSTRQVIEAGLHGLFISRRPTSPADEPQISARLADPAGAARRHPEAFADGKRD